MSITTNCAINQVIWYFLTNCFNFLTKVWMPQVRKSCSCVMSAIQCCFMIEGQVLMTVSDFSRFYLGIISRKGASFFNRVGGGVFQIRGFIFKWWATPWGASVLMGGGCWKKLYSDAGGVPHMSPHAPPPLWETLIHVMNITRLEVVDSLVEIYHYRFGFYAQCTPFWVKQFFQILESVSK